MEESMKYVFPTPLVLLPGSPPDTTTRATRRRSSSLARLLTCTRQRALGLLPRHFPRLLGQAPWPHRTTALAWVRRAFPTQRWRLREHRKRPIEVEPDRWLLVTRSYRA